MSLTLRTPTQTMKIYDDANISISTFHEFAFKCNKIWSGRKCALDSKQPRRSSRLKGHIAHLSNTSIMKSILKDHDLDKLELTLPKDASTQVTIFLILFHPKDYNFFIKLESTQSEDGFKKLQLFQANGFYRTDFKRLLIIHSQ